MKYVRGSSEPASDANPLLRGLTLDQVEAIRGYIETVAAVTNMFAAIEEAHHPDAVLRFVDGVEAIRAQVYDTDSAYADGVRFALNVSTVADKFNEIGAAIVAARAPIKPAGVRRGIAKLEASEKSAT